MDLTANKLSDQYGLVIIILYQMYTMINLV